MFMVDETGSDKPKVDETEAKWNMYSDIRIKAIVDNFDNHTIIDYLTALSYWVGQ